MAAHTPSSCGSSGGRRKRRPLGGFEHFHWRAHRIGCGLIYAIADTTASAAPHPLAGADAPELLRQAALLAARRHPNLRARIGVDSTGDPYLEELPLDDFLAEYPAHVPLVTDQSAVQFTEGLLLSTPIPTAAAPLWQLALVRHAGSDPQLVLLAHHSVLDGESVVKFLREIVTNVHTIQGTLPPQSPGDIAAMLAAAPAPLPFLPAQDELYATLLAGGDGDGWLSRLRFTLKRLAWLVQRPTVPSPERITTDTSQRRNRIYSTQVQGEAFARLLRRCKAEGTTLTAAMAAAVMLEIKALMPGQAAALKVETMVNLRAKLAEKDPRLADSLHLFAAPIDMVLSVGAEEKEEEEGGATKQQQSQQGQQGGGLWARARAFKADLNEAMADGQWRHQVAAFRSFQRAGGLVYRVLEKRIAVDATQGRVKATAISNLGSLDAKLATGAGGRQPAQSWAISRLQWGITEHGIGQWAFVAVSSQGGSLNLTLTCVDPIVSPARANALLAGIVRRLLVDPQPAALAVDAVGRLQGAAAECTRGRV